MFPSAEEPDPASGVPADAVPIARPGLRAFVSERDCAALISFRGEADALTLPLWRTHIRSAAAIARRIGGPLVVDTTRLDFLGWRPLAALAEEADRLDGGIVLVSDSHTVARMVAAGELDGRLALYPTVLEALTEVRARGPATATPVPAGEPADDGGREYGSIPGRNDRPR